MCPPPPIPIDAAQVAYVNSQENSGRTALHFAAMNENAAMIQMLIDHGADPCIRDGMGCIARDYTRESSFAYEILRCAEVETSSLVSLVSLVN
jgi:hypothetical protein